MQVKERYTLDTFQQKACDALDNNYNILVSAPTGSGKTAIAEYAIEKTLEIADACIIYTCPIKSLSNEKYYDFTKKYENKVSIGLMTGDIKINENAQIIIMTTEVLLNILSGSKDINIKCIIFDEAHYLNDDERGHVWEKCIIYSLLKYDCKIVLLSATIGNIDIVMDWLNSIQSEKKFEKIIKLDRPVPLKEYFVNSKNKFIPVNDINYKQVVQHWEWLKSKDYSVNYELNKLIEKISNQETISSEDSTILGIPAIVFVFSKNKCEEFANDIEHSLVNPKEETEILNFYQSNLKGYENTKQYNDLIKIIKKGIAYHHSGLIPRIREVIEFLMKNKLIKLVFATETFAVGLNFPVKTVVLTSIRKPTENGYRNLLVSEYKQMAGRAGRRFIDKVGNVVLWFYPESTKRNKNIYPLWTELYHIINGSMNQITSKYILEPNYILKHLDDFLDISDKSFKYYKFIKNNNNLIISDNFQEIIDNINICEYDNDFMISYKKDYHKLYNKLTLQEQKEFDSIFKLYQNKIKKTEYDYFKQDIDNILYFLENLELITINENNKYIKTKWGNIAQSLIYINPIIFVTEMDVIVENSIDIIPILSMFIEDGDNKDYVVPPDSIVSYFDERINTVYKDCMILPNWKFYPKNYNIVYDWLYTDIHIDELAKKYDIDCGLIVKIMIKMYQIIEELIKVLPDINKVELVDYITNLKEKIIRLPITIDSLYIHK